MNKGLSFFLGSLFFLIYLKAFVFGYYIIEKTFLKNLPQKPFSETFFNNLPQKHFPTLFLYNNNSYF